VYGPSFQAGSLSDPVATSRVSTENISAKRSDGLLLRFYFQIDAYSFAEKGNVFFLGQPRSEPARFALPDVPNVNTLQPAERDLRITR
jgi:hypothetical protein